MSDFEDEFEVLAENFPSLMAFHPFLTLAAGARWFRSVGEVPTKTIQQRAEDYCFSLGFPEALPAFIHSWEDAADATDSLDLNSPAWEAEEQLRAALSTELVEMVGDDVATMLMNHLSETLTPIVEEAATEASDFLRIEDEAFTRAMMGAAIQAAHMAALVALTGAADDHPFAAKFALFEAGRWPLAIVGGSFLIF